jgi:hypothetical protein
MPRPKQPPSTKPPVSTAPLSPSADSGAKAKIIGFFALILVLTAALSSGWIQDLFAGPKIPLPRQSADFSLGISKEDFLQKFPSAKKKFRSYNDDPLFSIVTVDKSMGLAGASSADLLFFQDNLYFISATWDSAEAKDIPLDQWVKQYRRWGHAAGSGPQNLGDNVLLKEWHFDDKKTEMTLMDLNYTDHMQRWQNIRDASNEPAQTAFAKHRIDAGS